MVKAFFIACQSDKELAAKALNHCHIIANRYDNKVLQIERNNFQIMVVTTSKDDLVAADNNSIKFTLGVLINASERWDRFLKVSVDQDGLQIENDYAASIPVYYSQRNGLVLSNIEPCVYLATGSTLEDLSYENLYGFMRYNHFIWDETAWRHIKQMLPDSKYIFSSTGELLSCNYIETVRASDFRVGFSDKQVANDLFELNRFLVSRSLANANEIILPLSSGYDSRMIFAALANDKELAPKTRCFTYGSVGSIEVEGGRRLSKLKGVEWHHINLPCKFLNRSYLREVAGIFGASLHMHGMYQIEFYKEIKKKHGISSNAWLTSGFMTGVPAGQHNGLLRITGPYCRLTDAMNHFSQSKIWTDDDLQRMPIFAGKKYIELAEERFRLAFDRFQGEIHQKAVMFDVWTRQRNFISYYPRTLEWFSPIASPHMCTEYANFFMSLKKEHLLDRKAVELMLIHYYSDIAKIISNSNGIASLNSKWENNMLLLSRKFHRLKIPYLLPKSFRNASFEFDTQAVKNCGEDAFYPLFSTNPEITLFLEGFGGERLIRNLYSLSNGGDVKSYERSLALQAIAFNLVLGATS